MIQVNRIYLIFNRLVTKKFLVDTSVHTYEITFYKLLLQTEMFSNRTQCMCREE